MSTLRFEDLSDEVLLEIFSFLDVQDLLRWAMTSRRIRAICLDSSLSRWKKINLYFKTVPTSFIEFILDTGGRGPGGCKYLSLWSAVRYTSLLLAQSSKGKEGVGASKTEHDSSSGSLVVLIAGKVSI